MKVLHLRQEKGQFIDMQSASPSEKNMAFVFVQFISPGHGQTAELSG